MCPSPQTATKACNPLSRGASKLAASVASALVPASCVLCREGLRRQAVLCGRCIHQLQCLRLDNPDVPHRPAGVKSCFAACEHKGLAAAAVARLKFAGYVSLARPIAELLVAALPQAGAYEALVPVPCGPTRYRKRGFDQSVEIANQVSLLTGLPVAPVLRRGDNVRQLGSSRSTRRQSSRIMLKAVETSPFSILLIDDVQTTGTTLGVAATALRAAGAKQVSAATFTRSL